MSPLRWVLLLLGIALLLGIYLYGLRRERKRPKDLLQDASRAAEDGTDEERGDPLSAELDQLNRLIDGRFDPTPGELPELDGAPAADARRDQAAPSAVQRRAASAGGTSSAAIAERNRDTEQRIVALHVAAPRGEQFEGAELRSLFAQRGYSFGELHIYHHLHQGEPLFSIANMVKPGWFDPDTMDRFTSPGISLFLQLPGPHPAPLAFDALLTEARALAEALGGVLQDADHSTLSRQTIQHLREGLVEYQLRRERSGSA